MKQRPVILIADDDADDREIIRDAFFQTTQEPEYVFLENGEKLLDYLESYLHDPACVLILLDLNMPGKDGRETLRHIKENSRYQRIPTIVFTTSSSARDREMAYNLGANCFITKPDTYNKMLDLTQSIARLWL